MDSSRRTQRIDAASALVRAALTGLLWTQADAAQAHSLHVFTAVVGATIEGRAYYGDNQPAAGASVRIRTANGAPTAQLTADEDGRFRHTASHRADYVVIVETADLHRAEARIPAGHFPSSLPFWESAPASGETKASDRAADRAAERDGELRQILERLDRLETTIGLRDILGGIGFVLGAIALACFLKRRSH
jgi:nickel transport protein